MYSVSIKLRNKLSPSFSGTKMMSLLVEPWSVDLLDLSLNIFSAETQTFGVKHSIALIKYAVV